MRTTKSTFLVVKATKTGYLVVGGDGVPFEFGRDAIHQGIVSGMLEQAEPTWAVLQWRLP